MAFSSNVAPVSSQAGMDSRPGSGSRSKEPASAIRNSRSLPGFVVAQYRRNSGLQRLLLYSDQLQDAAAADVKQLRQLGVVEGRLFGCSLQLDKSAGTGHHQVHVDMSVGIFVVAEV